MTTEGRLTMINCKMLFYHLLVMMAFDGDMVGGRLTCYQCSGFEEPWWRFNPGICEGSSCVSLTLRDDKNTELERMRFCSNILTSSERGECLWDFNNMQHTCICSQVDKCNNYRSEYEARSEGKEYTCYQCSGDQCKLSNDKLQKCIGSACMTVTLEFNGKSETLRACSFKNRDIKSGCVNDVIYKDAVKRKTCRCMGDYCNGSNEVKAKAAYLMTFVTFLMSVVLRG